MTARSSLVHSLSQPLHRREWLKASAAGLAMLSSWGCDRSDARKSENTAPQSTAPQNTAPPSDSELRSLVTETLDFNRNRRILSVDRNAAWQVAHGAIAYGRELLLDVEGQTTSALDYLFGGGTMRGWQLAAGPVLASTKRPSLKAFVEAGSYVGQGHVDQFLGYLSQSSLPLNTSILADGQKLTLEDWGRTAQWDVPNNPYREYSWTLIALTNLFPEEYQWTAADGQTWTLEPLVEFEAKQDIGSSPCGGMHRLMGLAHSVRYWKGRGMSARGGWALAEQVVEQAIGKTRAFQNSDGSFSTNYTVRPGRSSDLSTRIGTTGHTLEFLVFALPPDSLKETWVERAVQRLCMMLQLASEVELECGGLYHGLAGLKLFLDRRWPARTGSGAA